MHLLILIIRLLDSLVRRYVCRAWVLRVLVRVAG